MTLTYKLVAVGAVSLLLAFGILGLAYAAPPTDACSLLTQEQVSTALGVPVGPGEKTLPISSAICGWEVPSHKTSDRKRVLLSIYTQLGSLTPVQRFDTAKTPMQGIPKEPVNGIGDDAIFATTRGVGTGLIFRKGEAAFDLRVYGFPVDQLKVKEKELALKVLAKL